VHEGCPPKSYNRYAPSKGNPTFTTVDSIVQPLRDIGVWERFVEWHTMELYNFQEPKWNEPPLRIWVLDYQRTHRASADILTTPELLAQALHSYVKEAINDRKG
jgi:hypothetical protein